MANNTAASGANSERVSICAGRYEVFPGSPLPHYNTPASMAFAAQGTRGNANILALVVRPGEFPRFEMIGNAANVNSAGALRFLEYDVAYWADFGQHVPIILYERPAGPPLFENLYDERAPLNNEIHFRQAVESISEGIRDIYLAGVNHGRINPTNLFMRDATSGSLQLGDYLDSPPCTHQHAAYCTIEQAMCTPPVGRGPASASDDIYAMGVTLLHLIFGKIPLLKASTEEIVRAKVERGSLMALSGGMRIPSAYSEILRGLLADDIAQRWALDDVSHWLSGRRLGSKPSAQALKAQRAFDFNGQSFTSLRLLAQALPQQPDLAARHIEDNSLDRWLRRSLGDEERAEKVMEAINSAASTQRGGSPSERAVTRISITLDPASPIRFRDLAAMPTGIGALLADTIAKGHSPRNIADLISAQFVIHWVNSQPIVGEYTTIMQQFEGQRMLLDRPQPGFGVERVLYELNSNIPCLSPMLANQFPLTLKSVMVALEAHAATIPQDDNRSEPMDRHIAAFLLSRHRRMNDRLFPLLTPNSDPGQRAVAILSILSEIQHKFHPEPVPHISEWISRLLQPAMERYHNRALRERVMKDVRKQAKRGELGKILAVIDDGNLLKQDLDGFDAAHMEWLYLEKTARELSSNSEARDRSLLRQGQQITAFIGAITATVAVVISVFVKLI